MDHHERALTAAVPGRPEWLEPWLAWLDSMLHGEVLKLRARYRITREELHGLYISDEFVEALLIGADRRGPSKPLAAHAVGMLTGGHGAGSPLDVIGLEFKLAPVEKLAVLLALAPELDAKYRGVFAYLNDDAGRPLPTVDLCLRLWQDGRQLLTSEAAAIRDGLLCVVPGPGAAHWRSSGLLLSDPVREFLLGVNAPQHPDTPDYVPVAVVDAASAVADGLRTVVIEAALPLDGELAAQGIAARVGRALVALPPDRLADLPSVALRARLHGACLLVSDFAGTPAERPQRVWSIAGAQHGVVLLVTTRQPEAWATALGGITHIALTTLAPPPAERASMWRSALRREGVEVGSASITSVADVFALSPAQICTAAAAAAHANRRRPDLVRHARAQGSTPLPTLATSVETGYRWDDLVLPRGTTRRLHELASAMRNRRRVFDVWDFERLQGSQSLRALFVGVSGTGKTMAAAVVADAIGMPLWRVDLSAVVSKYIGETEKNLEEVFRATERSNAVLMFDEADALFGKRSEISDAHDRYANIEVAFLLQRMETFDGILLLATNLSANMDEAFQRRIHIEIDFPLPDEAARAELWRRALPDAAPVDDDVDSGHLARMVALSGGEIRNAALAAAFLAAHDDRPIGMVHLVRAIARQRGRMGKLPTVAEFGDYLHLVRSETA